MRQAVLFLFAILVLSGNIYAQGAEQFDMNMGAALTRMLVSLGLIVLLIIGLVYALKRFFPKVFGAPANITTDGKKIEILDFKPIAPKRILYLLKVEDKEFLISSHENGVTGIGQWDSSAETKKGFDQVLKNVDNQEN